MEIGFRCFERLGTTIYKVVRDPDARIIEEPLTHQEDLHPGMEVAIPSGIGGYHMMIVKCVGDTWSAHGGKYVGSLVFSREHPEEFAPEWVCVGVANLAGLQRLMITT